MSLLNNSNNKLSFYTATTACVVIGLFILKDPPQVIISWDVFGYYLYLPAFVIHHDAGIKDFSFVQNLLDVYNPTGTFYQASKTPLGFWVDKYTMGMAVFYFPAFIVAHVYAKLFAFPADGLSAPYQTSLIIWSFIFTLVGIYFLRKILLRYFSDSVTAAVILLISFGTNYFQNAVYSGSMPHNYLFTMYAMLIWFTIRWHENQKMGYAVLIGLICGLSTLSRPSEIISVLIPVLWGIKSKDDFLTKLKLVKEKWLHLFIAALFACLVCLPQLYYWKYTTGNWFYNSYSNPGEGFEFLSPYTWNVLFSFRKGWFIYTPIMLFAVPGFYFLRKYKSEMFYSFIAFFILNLYIVSSWSCWWYADSFSQRALVQSYPLLAFPLACFVQWIAEKKRATQLLITAVFFLLIVLNLFQTWQVFRGIIHSSRMTKEYYLSVFGKTKIPEGAENKLMVFRSYSGTEQFTDEKDYNTVSKDIMDFEESQHEPWASHLDTLSNSGSYSFKLDSTTNYSPNFIRKYSTLTDKDHAWIRFTVWVFPAKSINENTFTVIASFRHGGKDYKYNGADFRQQTIIPDQWNKVRFDYLTPEVRTKTDSLHAFFWLQGKYPVYIDDFKMEVFEKK